MWRRWMGVCHDTFYFRRNTLGAWLLLITLDAMYTAPLTGSFGVMSITSRSEASSMTVDVAT